MQMIQWPILDVAMPWNNWKKYKSLIKNMLRVTLKTTFLK